ncbi:MULTISPECIES: hypothetical protein [Streptomyces]|uniref:Uncharacterized protein n=2 Tax=Streptomyces bottropensis TaxID=42235 RepID=M3F7C7_9ACTN|nr:MULTISPECIES: hypothetical protein [Streptomyces]EMF57543.1 hypothetical protein SBD_0215 [Streptomyces bottropensis ATCC 25435]MZD18090.1 hypothetical protein [Streptomyces sp. SID5476]
MADVFELTVTIDLRHDIAERELAELRWHLGLDSEPDVLSIVTDFPVVVEDERGRPMIENHPGPLLGRHDQASKVDGSPASALVRRQHSEADAWSLTSRQEIHPDDFERVGQLLTWLATKADSRHRNPDGEVTLGWTRFYEDPRPEPLVVCDGAVMWPS